MKHYDAGDFQQRREEGGELPLFAAVPLEPARPGLLDASKLPATDAERRVAELLEPHQGRENPLPLAALCEATAMTEREVKGVIERLRSDHHVRIGARRTPPAGYFIVVDAADAEVALKPYREQVMTMLRTMRLFMTEADRQQLAGQLRLALEGRDDVR